MKSKREFRIHQFDRFIYWVITFTKRGCPKLSPHNYFHTDEHHYIPNTLHYSGDNVYYLKTIPVHYV